MDMHVFLRRRCFTGIFIYCKENLSADQFHLMTYSALLWRTEENNVSNMSARIILET